MEDDRKVTELALRAVNLCVSIVVEEQVKQSSKSVARSIAFAIVSREQELHEPFALVLDDSLFWVEDTVEGAVIEECAEFLLNAILESPELRNHLIDTHCKDQDVGQEEGWSEGGMWEAPSVVEGSLESFSKHEENDWFDRLYTGYLYNSVSVHGEGARQVWSYMATEDEAATNIQARIRGYLGRKAGRRLFVKRFAKR